MMEIRHLLKKQAEEHQKTNKDAKLNQLKLQQNTYWFPRDNNLLSAMPVGIEPDPTWESQDITENMNRYKAMFNEVAQDRTGWPEVTYDINSHGFRCPPFQTIDYTKQQILVVGCSFSFGMGLNQNHLWHDYLNDGFPEAQIWNLGVPGCSNDTITRLVYRAAPVIRPSIIIIQWSHFNRREYITDTNRIKRILPNHPRFHTDATEAYKGFFDMHNKFNDQYCFDKNLAFMSMIAKGHNIIFLWDIIDNFPLIDYARDDEHPGIESSKLFAVQIYKQYLDTVVYKDERSKFLEEFLNKIDAR